MTRSLRQSLNVLHTWGGLVAGSLIFFVFFTGSLVVFEQSIDRWSICPTKDEKRTETQPSASPAR